ncbi:MAG TPA: DUF1634 domain-containing protein, partial [Planctomycetaceae bacterium]|nr:DUF1634 domain-containing protein [Planctomycetaceae bacterium]
DDPEKYDTEKHDTAKYAAEKRDTEKEVDTLKEYDQLAPLVRRTLQIGLMAAVVLILLGGVLAVTRSASKDPHDSGMFSRALKGDSAAILGVGLLILMLTPVARVLVLAIGWLRIGDWTFSVVAFCVLAMLVLSVLLGTG